MVVTAGVTIADPVRGSVPLPTLGEMLTEVALIALHCKVLDAPKAIMAGFAAKATTGVETGCGWAGGVG